MLRTRYHAWSISCIQGCVCLVLLISHIGILTRNTVLWCLNSKLMSRIINSISKPSFNMIIDFIDGANLVYRCVHLLLLLLAENPLIFSVLSRSQSIPVHLNHWHGIRVVNLFMTWSECRWLWLIGVDCSPLRSCHTHGVGLIGHFSCWIVYQWGRGVLETVLKGTIL